MCRTNQPPTNGHYFGIANLGNPSSSRNRPPISPTPCFSHLIGCLSVATWRATCEDAPLPRYRDIDCNSSHPVAWSLTLHRLGYLSWAEFSDVLFQMSDVFFLIYFLSLNYFFFQVFAFGRLSQLGGQPLKQGNTREPAKKGPRSRAAQRECRGNRFFASAVLTGMRISLCFVGKHATLVISRQRAIIHRIADRIFRQQGSAAIKLSLCCDFSCSRPTSCCSRGHPPH